MAEHRYRILELDLEKPFPAVAFEGGEAGVALVMRRRARLVGFAMRPREGRDRLEAEEVGRLAAREAAERCLAERLREERASPAPQPRMPSVTVAICTRNRPESLTRCLASLVALDPAPADLTEGFEILVVDNAPPHDRTRRAVEAVPGIRYAMEPRPGLNFGRNRALREARGSILAFVDDDVVVDRGWLGGLHEAWSENPDARGFTGLVLPYALETEAQILFELRGGFRRGLDKIRYRGRRQDNQLFPCGAGVFGAGANMAFDRAALIEIGGFDDALDTGQPLPGGGDLDIFYRIARTGYPFIYEPQFAVFHEHRKDLPGLRRQYWTWGLAHMAFVMKSLAADAPYRTRFRLLILWWFRDQLQQLARSLLGRHVLPPGMVAAELWGGVVGLFGEYDRSQRRVQRIREAHP
jgi:GT2 family glycosyltransferase